MQTLFSRGQHRETTTVAAAASQVRKVRQICEEGGGKRGKRRDGEERKRREGKEASLDYVLCVPVKPDVV